MPHFLFERNEGGMSNYGVHAKTVVSYSFALGLSGIFTVKAASLVNQKKEITKTLRKLLVVLGLSSIVVLLSTYPYKIDTLLADIHIGISILLFAFEVIASIWFVRTLSRNWINAVLLGVQTLGFLLILGSAIGIVHILLLAQLVASLAFGIFLVRAVSRIT
jgi:hypothetical protein